MAKIKDTIKTTKGIIRRDDLSFWNATYEEYLTVRSSAILADSLGIDVRMLTNIFKEHGLNKRTSSESRTGKIKKAYIETKDGVKLDLYDFNYWNEVHSKYYIENNYSESRLSEYLGITRKQLRRVFKYHNFTSKTEQQVKDTILESNRITYGVDRPSIDINIKRKISKTHLGNVVKNMIADIDEMGYELLDEYEGTRTFNTGGPNSVTYNEYRFRHKECGTVFVDNLRRSPRCTKCYSNLSQAEDRIRIFINGLGFTTERKILEDGKHLDIYIPELKIAFEYNGTIWHSSKYKTKSNYHKNKTEQALKEGISLYHIWEYENELIVKSKISYILNKACIRHYARKLELKEVVGKDRELFLSSNHSFGDCSSLFSVGLYSDSELISIMCFRRSKENDIEMVRYCNKINTSVVGGFDKLLKHSIKLIKERYNNVVRIISFGYRDMCPDYKNSVYFKNGFSFKGYLNPTLMYYKHSNRTIHNRQKFMKNKLEKLFPEAYDSSLTELDILNKVGIYSIHNSGIIKFEMEI